MWEESLVIEVFSVVNRLSSTLAMSLFKPRLNDQSNMYKEDKAATHEHTRMQKASC